MSPTQRTRFFIFLIAALFIAGFTILFTPPAHGATPNPDVEKAIRIIEATPEPVTFTMPPKPTVVGANTYMVTGRGVTLENCPGYEGAIIAYFSDPTGTIRTLSVITNVNGKMEVLGDSDRDGTPETAVIAGMDNSFTGKTPGSAEHRAYTAVVLCTAALTKQ